MPLLSGETLNMSGTQLLFFYIQNRTSGVETFGLRRSQDIQTFLDWPVFKKG
jgi:hypothetical protein